MRGYGEGRMAVLDRFSRFVRREMVFCISFLAALCSSFFVPPDREWLGYFDLRTLALLYCLMAIVAGLRKAGTFSYLAHVLCQRSKNIRLLCLLLVGLSFFSSMFITNDVALLTFVPFAVVVLEMAGEERYLPYVVVLQTVAANLGSMLLPVGNPQNLYIHSYYQLSLFEFFSVTCPIWLLSLALLFILCLLLPRKTLSLTLEDNQKPDKKQIFVYLILFALCLLVVFRILNWPLLLGILLLVLFIFDRKVLLLPDFMLLLTFCCFFIFAGNLARIEKISTFLCKLLLGREFLISVLSSQVISNVPAALLLSGFTGASSAILAGTNVGGLGTPIASLASLIALRLYAQAKNVKMARFLILFILINILLLLLLSVFTLFFVKI